MEESTIKLENQLCFSLYTASREVIRLYKPILDEFSLTYTQYIALIVLWEHEKITVKQIGEKLHLDSGTLTPLLKKLENMNLITRYRDVDDNRVVYAELTPIGRDLQQQMLEVPSRVACQVQLNIDEALLLKKQLDALLEQFK